MDCGNKLFSHVVLLKYSAMKITAKEMTLKEYSWAMNHNLGSLTALLLTVKATEINMGRGGNRLVASNPSVQTEPRFIMFKEIFIATLEVNLRLIQTRCPFMCDRFWGFKSCSQIQYKILYCL